MPPPPPPGSSPPPASLYLHDAFAVHTLALLGLFHQRKRTLVRVGLLRLRHAAPQPARTLLLLGYVWYDVLIRRAPPPPSLTVSVSMSVSLSTARTSILSMLRSAISVGQLVIEDHDETFRFGSPKSDPVVHLKVHSGKFWTRVFRCARGTLSPPVDVCADMGREPLLLLL